ncbi:AAA family ATPase [Vibrio harveyi]|uniref:AAA family ATPase n=1 Tax=Vibrio harveyi TaxID=669 RepID=UPI002893A174|nr:AAA domain-containing protein [Vibrio harveyi]
MSLIDVANQLNEIDKPIVLIYAFNGTGKTQLSVAYKNVTKEKNEGQHAGVYYNAYSEDLFHWDNDEDNDGLNVKLSLLPSNLNQFHSFLSDDPQVIERKLALYNARFKFEFNLFEDIEKGIESISFYTLDDEDKNNPIKISRGEESIFIWCFYLALLDVDGWADEQDAHLFIDDPVSSLDENNIFITADTIFEQIESHYEKKKIIITTHHIGLFSILANRLFNGEKSGRYKNLTTCRVLKRSGGDIVLEETKRNVFLYHLHLLQVLNEAINEQLYTYHFALLRQLLENISSFQGSGSSGRVLGKLGFEGVESLMELVNTHSHKTPYYYQTEMMNETEQSDFKMIFSKLIEMYHFKF